MDSLITKIINILKILWDSHKYIRYAKWNAIDLISKEFITLSEKEFCDKVIPALMHARTHTHRLRLGRHRQH